ncbi:hypothetical protein JW960_00900 [candidate division KSB1 bacterium]|nr:hypothetical protein [candidate division KSB1 bacterium]
MTHHFSEAYIRSEVGHVMHPCINCSLVKLGIVKRIEFEQEAVKITLAMPFADVTIKDYQLESVRESIEEVEPPVDIQTVVMTKPELRTFLSLEKQYTKHE